MVASRIVRARFSHICIISQKLHEGHDGISAWPHGNTFHARLPFRCLSRSHICCQCRFFLAIKIMPNEPHCHRIALWNSSSHVPLRSSPLRPERELPFQVESVNFRQPSTTLPSYHMMARKIFPNDGCFEVQKWSGVRAVNALSRQQANLLVFSIQIKQFMSFPST